MKRNFARIVSWLLIIATLAALPVTAMAADHVHTFDDVVKSAPTCNDEGHTTKTCSTCGYKTREEYTPARHKFGAGVYSAPSGSKEVGTYKYTCTVCGYSYIADDHAHYYTEIKHPANCVSYGYSEFHCTDCDEIYYKYDTIAPKGHTWGAWKTVTAASTDKSGEEKRVCSVCKEVETRPIEMLAPSAKTVTITNKEFAKVYKSANTDAAVVGYALKGSKFNLEARNAGKTWARIGTDKWIQLADASIDYAKTITSAYAGAKYYGIPKGSIQLKVRSGPSELSALVSSMSSDARLQIYTTAKDVTDITWGRISKTEEKWVDLTNVSLYPIIAGTLPDGNSGAVISTTPSTTPSTSTSTSSSNTVIATGTVNSAVSVNVRKEPKITVTNLVGTIPTGSKVEIYETKTVNGSTWGRIKYNGSKAWVCLNYVTMDGASSSTGTAAGSTAAAVENATVVNCSTGVNVRSSNSATSSLVGVIPLNSRIAITKLKDGWGYVSGRGWVYMAYVQLDAGAEEAINAGTKKPAASTSTPVETPIPTHTAVSVPTVVKNNTGIYAKPSATSKNQLNLMADPEVLIVVTDRTIVNGEQWGKVTVGDITGWVMMKNMTQLAVSGTVSATSTNLYTNRDVDSEVITTLGNGTKVTIAADSQTTDGTYVWGQVAGTTGYVQLHNVALSFREDAAESNNANILAVSITGTINTANTPLKKTASDSAITLVELKKGASVTIKEWQSVAGILWAKTSIGQYSGWIKMSAVTQSAISGTVTAETVNLYNSYTGGTIELVLRKGESVKVLERVLYGTSVWGRINVNKKDYWGNLAGVTLAGQAAPTTPTEAAPTTAPAGSTGTSTVPTTSTSAAGTVVCATGVTVNVRASAGVTSAWVAGLKKGDKVTVYEQTMKDNAMWGRIDQGWVAMEYIDLSSKPTAGTSVYNGGTVLTSVPTGSVAVGFVNIDDLAIRQSNNQFSTKVGTLTKGATVVIHEQVLKDGMIWGRIEQGWICTSYVTLTGLAVTGSGTAGIVKGVFYTANIRSTPGVGNALVGKIMVNSPLEIYETKVYSNQTWGRTSIGWIVMDYVLTGSVPAI